MTGGLVVRIGVDAGGAGGRRDHPRRRVTRHRLRAGEHRRGRQNASPPQGGGVPSSGGPRRSNGAGGVPPAPHPL